MSSETSHSATVSSAKVEVRTPELELNTPSNMDVSLPIISDHSNPRKRPRRTVACAAPSYLVPDSDDEAIAEENVSHEYQSQRKGKKKAKAESSLQVWIKHLTALLKEEEKKVVHLSNPADEIHVNMYICPQYKEKKKTIEKKENGKPRYRLPKVRHERIAARHG